MTDRRLLLLALDALDISILQRAIAEGRVPNLAAYFEPAHKLQIDSLGEFMEGSVWPTFSSGLNPASHGHHWYIQWMAEDNAFVPASDPRLSIEPFWKAALEAGKRVTIFDLPYTSIVGHPLERTYNGWGVQDEMDEHAHPESFRKEIRKAHGRSYTQKDTMFELTVEERAALGRRSKASARQRSNVLLDLASRQDWDLFIMGFGEFHRAGHHLGSPMQFPGGATNETALMNILQPIDQAWPAIVKAAGEDCDIAIFALHGMEARHPYGHLTPAILDDLAGKPAAEADARPRADLVARIRNLLPRSIHENIWLRLPAATRAARMGAAALARQNPNDPIWLTDADCAMAFRINTQGRENPGVVPPGDTRTIAENLWKELQRYRTETGEPAFGSLIITDDLFTGPRRNRIPDFTVTYNHDVHSLAALIRDDGKTIPNTLPVVRNGLHTNQGFLWWRPATTFTTTAPNLNNEDLAPTILTRLGVTLPPHLQGRSILS